MKNMTAAERRRMVSRMKRFWKSRGEQGAARLELPKSAPKSTAPPEPRKRAASPVRFSSPGDRTWSRYFWDGTLLRGPLPSTAVVEGSERRAYMIWEAERWREVYRPDKRPGRWRYASGMGKQGRPVAAARVDEAKRRAGEAVAGGDPGQEWEQGASSRTRTARAVEALDLAHEALNLPLHPRLRELVERGELDKVVLFRTTRRKYDGHKWIEYPLAQPMTVRDIVREFVQQAQRVAASAIGEP